MCPSSTTHLVMARGRAMGLDLELGGDTVVAGTVDRRSGIWLGTPAEKSMGSGRPSPRCRGFMDQPRGGAGPVCKSTHLPPSLRPRFLHI